MPKIQNIFLVVKHILGCLFFSYWKLLHFRLWPASLHCWPTCHFVDYDKDSFLFFFWYLYVYYNDIVIFLFTLCSTWSLLESFCVLLWDYYFHCFVFFWNLGRGDLMNTCFSVCPYFYSLVRLLGICSVVFWEVLHSNRNLETKKQQKHDFQKNSCLP